MAVLTGYGPFALERGYRPVASVYCNPRWERRVRPKRLETPEVQFPKSGGTKTANAKRSAVREGAAEQWVGRKVKGATFDTQAPHARTLPRTAPTAHTQTHRLKRRSAERRGPKERARRLAAASPQQAGNFNFCFFHPETSSQNPALIRRPEKSNPGSERSDTDNYVNVITRFVPPSASSALEGELEDFCILFEVLARAI